MLVVSRKSGERIAIPQANIEISVCEVLKDGRVKLGVSAPRGLDIVRKEPRSDWREGAAKKYSAEAK